MIALSSSATQLSATPIVAPAVTVPTDGFATLLAGLAEVDVGATTAAETVSVPYEAPGELGEAAQLPSADHLAPAVTELGPTRPSAMVYPVAGGVLPDISPLPGLPGKRQAIAESGKNMPAEASYPDQSGDVIWSWAATAPLMPVLPARTLLTAQSAKPLDVALVRPGSLPVSRAAPLELATMKPDEPQIRQQSPTTLPIPAAVAPLPGEARSPPAPSSVTTVPQASSPAVPTRSAGMPPTLRAKKLALPLVPLPMQAPMPVAAADRSMAMPSAVPPSATTGPFVSPKPTTTNAPADIRMTPAKPATSSEIEIDAPAAALPRAGNKPAAPLRPEVAPAEPRQVLQLPLAQPAGQAFAVAITAAALTQGQHDQPRAITAPIGMAAPSIAGPISAALVPIEAKHGTLNPRQENTPQRIVDRVQVLLPALTDEIVEAPIRAAAAATTAVPQQAPSPLIQPAGRAFAAAITAVVRAGRDGDQPDAAAPPIGMTAPLDATRAAAVPVAADAKHGTLDLRQESGLRGMIDRIEILRDDAEARDTRIRLVPDALGAVDVSLRRDGERVHVHFTAENQTSARLLHEAQPRLAELAEARGIKLGEATVGADRDAGAGHARQQPRPAVTQPTAPTPAEAVADTNTDIRIA
jgi:flagellar hook-length control protein FliK